MQTSISGPDKSNIQGMILRGYTHPCSCHLLFEFGNKGASDFIKTIFPYVQSAVNWKNDKPKMMLNVGLTFSGIQKAKTAMPSNFPSTFMAGPTSVDSQRSLFDLGDSDPSKWVFGNAANPVDCVVHVYGMLPDDLEKLLGIVSDAAKANDFKELFPLNGGKDRLMQYPLPKDFVHFGFRDGMDNPDLSESLEPLPTVRYTDPGNLNNFLIGYGDNNLSAFRPGPISDDEAGFFAKDGCYNVFRMIYQDQETFDKFLDDNAETVSKKIDKPIEYSKEWLAAKLFGRWRNGSPLELSPDGPDASTETATNFNYLEDAKGMKCPFSAHSRVANPRDESIIITPADKPIPRLLRRGVPYGAPPKKGQDYSGERGLIGLFLCGAIASQFESINSWINTNSFSTLFQKPRTTQDAVAANRLKQGANTSFTIPTEYGDIKLSPLPQFIVTRGTVYCLFPSLSALKSCFQ